MKTKKNVFVLIAGLVALCAVVIGAAVLGYQDYQVISAPGNPASGYMRLYASGSQLGCKTSSGANCLSGAGATVPANCSLVYTDSTPSLQCQTAKGLAAVAYVAGSGTANAQTATYSPAIAAQADILGYPICWLPSNANTTSATFNPSGLGAQTIKKAGGSGLINLVANDLLTTAVACVIWDGTVYEMQNPQTGGGGTTSPLTTKGDLYTYSSTNARLPVGADGNCLTAQSAQTTGLLWASCTASGGGALTQLGQAIVGGTSTGLCSVATTTITCTSIPSTYSELEFDFFGQDTGGSALDFASLQFNGDGTAAYQVVYIEANNGAASGHYTTGSPQAICNLTGNMAATAHYATTCNVRIPGYANTTFYKPYTIYSAAFGTAATANASAIYGGGQYLSLSAISSLQFIGNANLPSGSTGTLYGKQ